MTDVRAAAGTAAARQRAFRRLSVPLGTPARALAAAALYRLLALGFSNPGPKLVRSVIRGCGELKIALGRSVLPPRAVYALKAVDQEWRAVRIEQFQDEYSRLFLGAGLVPLREGGFGDGLRFAGQPADIADLSGFYLAFGFVLPAEAANPPDHLGAELEFMSLLHLKLALAQQRGRTEHVRITRAAMAHFLDDHLGRWAEPFSAALAEAGAAPAYRTMGRLLAKIVDADCACLNVKPSRARAGSGKDPVAGEELICPLSTTR